MRAGATLAIAGGLGVVAWCGVVSHGLLARAAPGPAVVHHQPAAPPPARQATDADRRLELNKRLSQMLAEGRGGRLTDAPRAGPQAKRDMNAGGRSPAVRESTRSSPSTPRLPVRRQSTGLDLTTPVTKPSDPVACLTQAVYYEARSENEAGQAAVAEVVLNRAASGRYPSDICDVVYQRNTRTCQFTFTCDGSIGRFPVNPIAWARAESIARSVYSGEAKTILPRRSVNYHANYVRPTWASRLERVNRIGAHIFYGSPLDDRGTPGADPAVEPPVERGLVFVKNDALERAYALLTGRTDRSND